MPRPTTVRARGTNHTKCGYAKCGCTRDGYGPGGFNGDLDEYLGHLARIDQQPERVYSSREVTLRLRARGALPRLAGDGHEVRAMLEEAAVGVEVERVDTGPGSRPRYYYRYKPPRKPVPDWG
ncbi:MAG: hypothetical protein ACRDQA_05450 [Nocardioidaceae bacterium]